MALDHSLLNLASKIPLALNVPEREEMPTRVFEFTGYVEHLFWAYSLPNRIFLALTSGLGQVCALNVLSRYRSDWLLRCESGRTARTHTMGQERTVKTLSDNGLSSPIEGHSYVISYFPDKHSGVSVV